MNEKLVPIKRYRRRRSANVMGYHFRNFGIEEGDLLVTHDGILYRAEASSGWGKRCAGELTPRTIHPPEPGLVASIIAGEVWWCRRAEEM